MSEPSPLDTLQAQQGDYKEYIFKFNMVISNFLSHKEAAEKKHDEKRQELATKKEEVVNLTKDNEELWERIGAQQINAADIDNMLKEKEILQVNLQSLSVATKRGHTSRHIRGQCEDCHQTCLEGDHGEKQKVIAEEINPEALSLQEQLFKREISAREKLSQISNAVALNKKVRFFSYSCTCFHFPVVEGTDLHFHQF